MIMQIDEKIELQVLMRRRQELRCKLKDHFCAPVGQRNYDNFTLVVDELENVRGRIILLKNVN